MGDTIDADALAHDLRIGRELLRPCRVTQHHERFVCVPVDRTRERASERCRHPEHVEVISRDERTADPHRLGSRRKDREGIFAVRGKHQQRAVIALKFEKVRGAVRALRLSGARTPYLDDLGRVRIRQRP